MRNVIVKARVEVREAWRGLRGGDFMVAVFRSAFLSCQLKTPVEARRDSRDLDFMINYCTVVAV